MTHLYFPFSDYLGVLSQSCLATYQYFPTCRKQILPQGGACFMPQWMPVLPSSIWPPDSLRSCGSVVKSLLASAGDAGDSGSISGAGRSPGGGNGNPFQYSYLEDSRDRESWWAIVRRVTKSWAWCFLLISNALNSHMLWVSKLLFFITTLIFHVFVDKSFILTITSSGDFKIHVFNFPKIQVQDFLKSFFGCFSNCCEGVYLNGIS